MPEVSFEFYFKFCPRNGSPDDVQFGTLDELLYSLDKFKWESVWAANEPDTLRDFIFLIWLIENRHGAEYSLVVNRRELNVTTKFLHGAVAVTFSYPDETLFTQFNLGVDTSSLFER